VRAVLIVPQELITTAPATGRAHGIGVASGPRTAPAAISPRPAAGPRQWAPSARPAVAPAQEEVPVVSERTPNGLPQRRRHAAPSRAGSAAPKIPQPAEAPVQPGMWLAAFQDGVNGQAPVASPAGHTSDESAGKGEQ
jgi:hypothetical protein